MQHEESLLKCLHLLLNTVGCNLLIYKALLNEESIGLLKIISDYAYAFDVVDQYDYQTLEINETPEKEIYRLTYEEAIEQIRNVKQIYGNSELFGHEKDKSFQSSIPTIYQTFKGVDLFSCTS